MSTNDTKTMRAVVLQKPGGPENFAIQRVDIPTPGPTEVLIKVEYCGTDSHDTAVRKGQASWNFHSGMILGHEIGGTVVDVGKEVTTASPGDRVCTMPKLLCGTCEYCHTGNEALCAGKGTVEGTLGNVVDGGLAEYVVSPESSVFLVPEGVSLTDAAVAACSIATPYHAIVHAGEVKPEDTVLVTGAGGGLGVHCVQLIRFFGARVIAWTRSEAKRATLEKIGADEVICGTDETAPVWQQILDLTGGKGVDVVIDNVGSSAFSSAFRGLARHGRYVMLGELAGKKIQLNPAYVFLKRAKIIGVSSHNRSEVVTVLELIRDGKIKPIIGGMYPLEEISKVHTLIEEGAITGRAVLVP